LLRAEQREFRILIARLFGARRQQLGAAASVVRSAARSARSAAGKMLLGVDTQSRRAARLFRDGEDAANGISPVGAPAAFPLVDLGADDPVTEILAALEFATCAGFFGASPAMERALVSAETQALLFTLVRNLDATTVIEIGTYRASTTEALCRAVYANGGGTVHTVDPFRHQELSAILRQWPLALRSCLKTHEMSSSDFFAIALKEGVRAEIVFVDGNHDYEFALFDIECAAHLLRPGGFLVIDNIGQAGPFFAARDFLEKHPGWRECGPGGDKYRLGYAFDQHRTRIVNTDISVLRAPRHFLVGERPITPGERVWQAPQMSGVSLDIAAPATGRLYAQAVVRIFGSPPTETTVESHLDCRDALGATELPLPWNFSTADMGYVRRIELWVSWQGDRPLALREEPRLF
jgi:predicted O-methyltransferase YrrM